MKTEKTISNIEMEEKDLKDMSQSELISLIMKLNKKQVTAPKTKVVISPVPKPRK